MLQQELCRRTSFSVVRASVRAAVCLRINCVVIQSRQDASGLWNSEVSSYGEMGVPMATAAKGRTLDYPLSLPLFLILSLSLSVSRVIKDCTLINFSALSRAKCPGRGDSVCARTCVCVYGSMCMLQALLCMRPWPLNTLLSSIQHFSH